MASTFRGLEVGKSALNTASINQDVTGQNIANAKTAGYSRQRTVTAARVPVGSNYVLDQIYNKRVGQGSEVTDITQYRSDYLDKQFRNQDSDYNYYQYRDQGLTYLTGVVNELDDDSSVTVSLDDFKSSLQNLAKDSTSQENRLNVQQRATALIKSLGYVHSEMVDLWEDQNTSVQTVADSINSKTDQIAMLNSAIANYEHNGTTANDLRDERNTLLDELSGLVDITYSTNTTNDSMVDVQIGGVTLVSGSEKNSLSVDTSTTNAYTNQPENTLLLNDTIGGSGTYTLSTSSGVSNTIQIKGGELYAHMELLTSTDSTTPGIPYYIAQINQYAQSIAKQVNDIHTTGYTDPQDGSASQTGINFFEVPKDLSGNEDYSLITAGNLSLSQEVKDSVWNIAASSVKIDLSASSTNESNADIAAKLYSLADGGDFYTKLNTIVGHLAIVSDTNTGLLDTNQSMLNSISKQRTSLSGVSLDEETTNLIMYQQSYNVASRMITTVDEMLNTLINGTGRVGL